MTAGEVKRDRYGRYLLPDPETGRERSYTRTTTAAKCLSDTTALTKWKLRMALKGAAANRALVDVAASTDERAELDALAEAALEAAGAGNAAQAGTDLHAITEEIDLGRLWLKDVPEDALADVKAYVNTLHAAGVEIIPEYIERLVVNPAVDVAGTLDRIVRLPDGRLVIADLKTGQDLSYGWGDIAIQLAIYSHAEWMWDFGAERYVPLPAELDLTRGLVIHLPLGKADCSLYELDLTAGWAAAQLTTLVRRWRSKRDLVTPLDPARLRAAGELLARVQAATDLEGLTALWEAHTDLWTDRHTAAAQTRRLAFTNQ